MLHLRIDARLLLELLEPLHELFLHGGSLALLLLRLALSLFMSLGLLLQLKSRLGLFGRGLLHHLRLGLPDLFRFAEPLLEVGHLGVLRLELCDGFLLVALLRLMLFRSHRQRALSSLQSGYGLVFFVDKALNGFCGGAELALGGRGGLAFAFFTGFTFVLRFDFLALLVNLLLSLRFELSIASAGEYIYIRFAHVLQHSLLTFRSSSSSYCLSICNRVEKKV
jgi:hypothetical protein